MKKLSIFTALALTSLNSFSLELPEASKYDHRVRYVTYNPADVVQLDTVLGVATYIGLEPGEKYLTHAFGDSAAYAFTKSANHIFIKPIAEKANTNLIIVTDRRVYKFRLQFMENRNNALYELNFNYPDTKEKISKEEIAKQKLKNAFSVSPGANNFQYFMSGDTDIAPVNAWDNGQFTYFKFAPNQDLPAIYMVDESGNESMLNGTMRGASNNILMIHKIAKKFMIRLDDRALIVFNDAYGEQEISNNTGTSSPSVKRIVKGGE